METTLSFKSVIEIFQRLDTNVPLTIEERAIFYTEIYNAITGNFSFKYKTLLEVRRQKYKEHFHIGYDNAFKTLIKLIEDHMRDSITCWNDHTKKDARIVFSYLKRIDLFTCKEEKRFDVSEIPTLIDFMNVEQPHRIALGVI